MRKARSFLKISGKSRRYESFFPSWFACSDRALFQNKASYVKNLRAFFHHLPTKPRRWYLAKQEDYRDQNYVYLPRLTQQCSLYDKAVYDKNLRSLFSQLPTEPPLIFCETKRRRRIV